MVPSVRFVYPESGTFTQYIDQLEFLCNQLGIDMEIKLHHFVHGLVPHRKEALVLQQPGDYNTAVCFAKLKESTNHTNYDEILKNLGKKIHSQQINSSAQVSSVEYKDPVQMSKEIAKLKAEIRQLKQEKNTGSSMLYHPNYEK